MIVVSFLIACATTSPEVAVPTEPAPEVLAEVIPATEPVPVAEETVPTFTVDPSTPAVLALFGQATQYFGDKSFVITAVLLNSEDAGKDGWKSCAKLVPAQFGLTNATPSVFLTENDKTCEEDPDGFVKKVFVAAPEQMAFLPFEMNGEKLEVLSVTTVVPSAPAVNTPPSTEPAVADGTK
ncbi:MAG: hypothetical protein WC813_00100 [Patescibacteria group bacterium]|jgi:hypothetical protein